MKKYIQKDKMRQFKLKFIKRELGIGENEKMSGMSYEEFSRKSSKIMLMMVTQNNINFEKKVKTSDLIDLNLLNLNENNNVQIPDNTEEKNKNLKIETTIHDIILYNLIEYNMEIDIVVELENNIIYKLIEMFPKNVFFTNDFRSNKQKN